MGVTAHCNMESTGALITYFSVNPAFSLTPWPREFLQWICASHLFQFQLFFAQHLLFKSMLYFQKLLTNMQDHSAALQAHYKTCKVSFLNKRPQIHVHLCNPTSQVMEHLHSRSEKGLGSFHPSHCHPWECQAGCSCSYYWESSVKKDYKIQIQCCFRFISSLTRWAQGMLHTELGALRCTGPLKDEKSAPAGFCMIQSLF